MNRRMFLTAVMGTLSTLMVMAAMPDIKGSVVDENGQPLPFANIVLVSLPDSSFIDGTISDADGNFTIAATPSSGAVKVSMVGYATKVVTAGNNVKVQMVPASNVLGEVEIRATLPKTTLTPQGIETKVEGTVLSDIGTAKEALARVPGIMKGRDGLEVIGKGTPLVYINGRKVRDITELDRLESKAIRSVEVLNNPGAKYDANVGSVVIIRTLKQQGEGLGFDISLSDAPSLDYSDHTNMDRNLNLNYRRGSVDVFAGGNFHTYQDLQDSEIYQESRGDTHFMQNGYVKNGIDLAGYGFNGGLNWQINDNHSVGFRLENQIGIRADQNEELGESLYLMNTIANTVNLIDSVLAEGQYEMDETPVSMDGNLYYNGKVKGFGIDFNADFFMKDEGQLSKTDETDIKKRITTVRTKSLDKNRLLASKLILSHTLGSGMLEVGSESTSSYSYTDYFISGASAGEYSMQTDVFEDNVAAFAQYGFALLKKFNVSAGLRYEHISFEYLDNADHSRDVSRKYDNLFPSLSVAGMAGPVYAALSYSNKTVRPAFAQLSDAVRYNSRFTLQSGNSQLQSQIVQSINATLNFKAFTLVGEYSRVDDPIMAWSRPVDLSSPFYTEGAVVVSPRNLEDPFRQLTVYLNAAPTIAGIWVMNWTGGIQQQWLEYDVDEDYHLSFSDHPFFILQLNNSLLLPASWQADLGFEYHSRGNMENAYVENEYMDLSASIQKKFFKDGSLVLKLEGKDLLGLANYDVRSDLGYHVIRQTNRMDSRRICASLRYSFNTARSKYKGTGAGKEVMERMK